MITSTSVAVVQLKQILLSRMYAPKEEKEPIIQKIMSDIAFIREHLINIHTRLAL